jgi:3-isopropylmalate/(R)-2-methylmalate dehydratase small subunit
VISPRFGDIFRNNATKSGLVPVQVDPDFGAQLLEAAAEHPYLEIQIDIRNRTVSAPAVGLQSTFPLDDFTQYRLLEGLDDIGLTMRNEDKITAYEAQRPAYKPQVETPATQ